MATTTFFEYVIGLPYHLKNRGNVHYLIKELSAALNHYEKAWETSSVPKDLPGIISGLEHTRLLVASEPRSKHLFIIFVADATDGERHTVRQLLRNWPRNTKAVFVVVDEGKGKNFSSWLIGEVNAIKKLRDQIKTVIAETVKVDSATQREIITHLEKR